MKWWRWFRLYYISTWLYMDRFGELNIQLEKVRIRIRPKVKIGSTNIILPARIHIRCMTNNPSPRLIIYVRR